MGPNQGQLGGKPDFKENDPRYDEFREEQSEADLQEETFEYYRDQLEVAYTLPEEERQEFMKEIDEEMKDADPYTAFVYEQMKSMSDAELGLIEAVAERRPFSEAEMVAFVDMVTGLDFVQTDEETVFKLSYLKAVMDAMESADRIDFMVTMSEKMPQERQSGFISREEDHVVGVLQAMGMVTEDEVRSYVQERGNSVYAEGDIEEDIEGAYKQVLRDLAEQEGVKKKYTSSAYKGDYKSSMDRRATIGNLGKLFGVFVAGGTLFANASGALGYLIVERNLGKAMEHIKNHHYIGPSIIALTGLTRSLKHFDRPAKEAIISPNKMRLTQLVDSGVERSALSYMRNETIYRSVDDRLDSMTREQIDAMRNGDVLETFPEVASVLHDKGELPELEEERTALTNQLVELWLSLRSWNYWNYNSAEKFLRYCEEKHSKVKELKRLREEDEAEEKRLRGEEPEAPEEAIT